MPESKMKYIRTYCIIFVIKYRMEVIIIIIYLIPKGIDL